MISSTPHTGIYESLLTQLLETHLAEIEGQFYISTQKLEHAEAAAYLSRFLSDILYFSLNSLPQSHDQIKKQIELTNSLIKWLADYLKNIDLSENLLTSKGEILTALFETSNPVAANLKDYVAKITPQTGLSQSELFTGGHVGLSLDSELKREILSSDEICWIVSFVKWTGIRIFADILRGAVKRGTKIRIITTSYMGATDQKAVDFFAGLPNTELRLSYNTERERLHAKAYLFLRNSGFDTGYIGSSNLSRSALTNGLEWNLKVTTREIPHIIDKFKSTFETYWESSDFETYHVENEADRIRLHKALQMEKTGKKSSQDESFYFDIEPHNYQKEILERLEVERKIHNRYKNLLVAATGTGKTVISAFDFRTFYKIYPNAKLLFVAHRQEILKQARATFRSVLRTHSFGELWVGGEKPENYDHLFASVQILNNQLGSLQLSSDFYDFIIIDEVHHIAANSYRPIIDYFTPNILLGLTATPERHDGSDIREDFGGVIASELRLPEAINLRHLCPFQYFAVDDPVDLTNVQWVKGRYLPSELTHIYTTNDQRVGHILRSMEDILGDIHSIKALAFCVTQEHAQFMSIKFCLKGIKAAVLTSENSHERITLRNQLVEGKIQILCVVDIFNEGVDIPEVDTVLFLRPTESLTVFLQQLGRGLRLSEGKDCLTVLDFVGNAHVEYDFSQKFRALIGKSHISIEKELEEGFPHLPLGCSINLQKQAQKIILNNIRSAIVNQKKIISWIMNYRQQTDRELTLSYFLEIYPHVRLEDLYKIKIDGVGGWSRLCKKAGIISGSLNKKIEFAVYRAISTRFLQCNSHSYLLFLQKLLKSGTWNNESHVENQMAIMAHYDFWRQPGKEVGLNSIEESLSGFIREPLLQKECLEVIQILLDRISITEKPMALNFPTALQIHSRYSRDEILAAFGENSFIKKSSSREGVVFVKDVNCELLFVTLQKTEKKFSPTTLYHDYAINENLFHWQTQNSSRPDRGKGLSYIEHQKNGKQNILFVREKSQDEYGRTMGFVNLGPVQLVSYNGSQPMNITWKLTEPLPPYLWADAAKLAVG